MTDENESSAEKRGTRIMWIGTGAIILLIVGMMGANMFFHKDPSSGSKEMSSQSRTAPAQ